MVFITDPWFYALAVPAVLITGISKTGLSTALVLMPLAPIGVWLGMRLLYEGLK
jgi:uncharacterized protein